MDFVELVQDTISVDEILKKVSSEKCGAVSMFVGTTRDNFEGKNVIKLEYEAYDSMALKVMKTLCSEIRGKWAEVHNIAIIHRLGTVPVLEASVVIAISSPHRIDSLAAVQFCIENLKELGLKKKSYIESTKSILNSNVAAYSQSNVQVNATNDEIERRIRNYTTRKRDQINLSNIQDFITQTGEQKDQVESTCARVDAILVKRKGSKSHLKVMRVENEWGPQTVIHHSMTVKKTLLKKNLSGSATSSNTGTEERILNAEAHLRIIKPVSSDIYSRLKAIEERILELESISPEYAMFWNNNTIATNEICESPKEKFSSKRFKFSLDDIKDKIDALEKKSYTEY